MIRAVTESGLRGRGGAGFPSGIKWRTVAEQAADQKFVCCNLDEGDSGTFADRMIAEGDPFTLIEGLVITGYATGATEGYIYCRGEYPDASRVLREAIDTARAHGYLGRGIRGSNVDFDLHVRDGAGAYVCGEETSMLDSLEGKRGEVRSRPPIPAVRGLFGKPTVVNNVLSSAAVPMIMADGAQAYQALGRDARVAPRSFNSRAISPVAASSRPASASPCANSSGLRRGHPLGSSDPRSPGRRTARCLPARGPGSMCR